MEIVWAHLVGEFYETPEGLWNLLGVYERLPCDSYPFSLNVRLAMRTHWPLTATGCPHRVLFRLVDPRGLTVCEYPREFTPGGSAGLENVSVASCHEIPLRFERPGFHELEILVNGERKYSLSILAGSENAPPVVGR